MLSWFPFGKIIKLSVVVGLLIAVFSVAKSNREKFSSLFLGDDATSRASVTEIAQAVGVIRMMIQNAQSFAEDNGMFEDDDDADDCDEDCADQTPSLAERLEALKELVGNSSIFPSDGYRHWPARRR